MSTKCVMNPAANQNPAVRAALNLGVIVERVVRLFSFCYT